MENNYNAISQHVNYGSGEIRTMIKDVMDIEGYPTLMGSASMRNVAPAKINASVVDRLVKNNCKIVAKTNMHELAFGITGVNPEFGTPINPKYPKLIPGGSSSGSAVAVAGKLVDFALGTDTGGSIRMPATCCGIYGLKPTFARISRNGVWPEHSSLDCIGPFARDLDSLELAMKIIDPSFENFNGKFLNTNLKIGVLEVEADDGVWRGVNHRLQACKVDVIKLQLKEMGNAYKAGLSIINYENWQAFKHLPKDQLGDDVRDRLIKAANVDEDELRQANVIRELFTNEVDVLLKEVDALVLPTLPTRPPTLEEARNPGLLIDLTKLVRPFNLSGHPAISIPLECENGLPVGMQIITRKMEDEKLIAIARQLEA